ncbi:MAG TPA: ATP-binding protein [Chloroflexaceae bacterium]|mgnify:CR=1 FL=1|nr:ATP-binding protein [Chloroflexaceae bacterium]
MAATDTLLARAEPWLRANVRDGLRAVLPLPVLALAWWFARMPLGTVATLGIVIYAALNIGLLLALRRAHNRGRDRRSLAYLLISAATDAILAAYMLLYAGPLTLGIFPLYVVLVLKALRYRRVALWMMLVPALLGPIDLAMLYLRERDEPLYTEQGLAYWGLVAGSVFFICMLLALAEYRLFTARRLSRSLEAARAEHAERVAELESVNKDLRVRIRRQQALEESLRAITGSLSLDDVLSQILDSLMQMLGAPQVSAAALTLSQGDGFTHRTLSDDARLRDQTLWAEALAQRVVATRAPVVVGDTLVEREWRDLQRAGAVAALSVPLIDPNNQVLGALTVVSNQRHHFTTIEARHLTSFSIQASVAIHNAELHTELARQRLMLEAVLRDIGDGLLVVNDQGAMVLANPVAYQALQHSHAHGGGLREALDRLNHEVREGEGAVLTRELKVGEDEHERHYEIYTSLVRVASDEEDQSLAAFTIHDISGQKAQEQQRVEFISMVSHELRNPLNTLNGFLKVVLAGKAGPLNELQQEFLGLADDQANALKGRITELLEFNRLESGRLRLQPQWANLADLILTTSARFQVSAEQFGLRITAEVPDSIPEVLMDDERVGQVITNLIENAMKATPSGGAITVSAEVGDHEVFVHVNDTGVGIPPDQQDKIFSRFYRLEHKGSKHGAHLGLGLSICQQIIEGHNGRIWVESEEGKGSRFSFTLPLVHREQTIGEAVA